MSPRTGTAYQADGSGKVAQHTEALGSGAEVNAGVVQLQFAFLSGEVPRRKCLGKSAEAIVALKPAKAEGAKGRTGRLALDHRTASVRSDPEWVSGADGRSGWEAWSAWDWIFGFSRAVGVYPWPPDRNRRMRNRMSGGVGAGAGPLWASSGHPIGSLFHLTLETMHSHDPPCFSICTWTVLKGSPLLCFQIT